MIGLLKGLLIFVFILFSGAQEMRAQEINVALNAKVFGSYFDAKNAVDGMLNDTYAFAKYDSNRGANFYIELPKFYIIKEIVVHWVPDFVPPKYRIMIGNDIFNYSFEKEVTDDSAEYSLVLNKGKRGRYVKIGVPPNQQGIDTIKISEIEVYTSTENRKLDFTGIKVNSASETQVSILWTTNIPTTGQVSYVLAEKLPQKVFQVKRDESFSETHTVRLSGLLAGREYAYIVTAFDIDRNARTSPVNWFRTAGVPIPYWKEFKISADTEALSFVINTGSPTKGLFLISDGVDTKSLALTQMRGERRIYVSGLLYDKKYNYLLHLRNQKGSLKRSGVVHTQPLNIALGKKVTGTFNAQIMDPFVKTDTDYQRRLVDGSTNYFTSMAQSSSIKQGPQFFVIDLGEIYPIKAVRIMWRKLAYSQNYIIQGSKDGKKFEYFAVNQSGDSGVFSRSSDGSPMLIVNTDIGGKEARYIKIYIPWMSRYYTKHEEWDFVQIFEVQVLKDNSRENWSMKQVAVEAQERVGK